MLDIKPANLIQFRIHSDPRFDITLFLKNLIMFDINVMQDKVYSG